MTQAALDAVNEARLGMKDVYTITIRLANTHYFRNQIDDTNVAFDCYNNIDCGDAIELVSLHRGAKLIMTKRRGE